MKVFVVLVAVAFVVCANGASINGRVVGGTDAPEGAYPYQVSLRKNSAHFCGGSIINSRYILTAAHCVFGSSPNSVVVAAGTNKRSEPGTQYNVVAITVHENYDPFTIRNDIALLRTSKAIEFNDRIKAISLPSVDSKDGEKVVLTGWGTTTFPGSAPNNLQQLDLIVVDIDFCKEEQGPRVTDTNVCTFTKSGEGACHGDSGGPLADPETNSVVGIVSWGKPCAVGKPDVFTRVYSFLKWIEDNQLSY